VGRISIARAAGRALWALTLGRPTAGLSLSRRWREEGFLINAAIPRPLASFFCGNIIPLKPEISGLLDVFFDPPPISPTSLATG